MISPCLNAHHCSAIKLGIGLPPGSNGSSGVRVWCPRISSRESRRDFLRKVDSRFASGASQLRKSTRQVG